jgi:cysteine desulfurase/selenocysteine lyase
VIYLNNAATSYPKPATVAHAMLACLESVPESLGRAVSEQADVTVVVACRKNLATLLGASDPNRIVFTGGATEALNLALRGLRLHGAHVITTAIEHNSVLRPLKNMERDGEIELTIVDCDGNGAVPPEGIEKSFRANTRLVVVNHASNVTGEILDVAAMAAIAHAHAAMILVDASQSAGCLPIDVAGWQLDLLAFTGHKSMLGPRGIGGLYIREGIDLAPLKVGGTGTHSGTLYQPDELPTRYEAGTLNVPGIAGLNAGVEFVLSSGIEAIGQLKQSRTQRMLDGLAEMPKVRLYGRRGGSGRLPVFCFNVQGLSPADVGYILENSFGIVARTGLHCAPLIHKAIGTWPEGTVRVSPSSFTTEGDVDGFLGAMNDICAAA